MNDILISAKQDEVFIPGGDTESDRLLVAANAAAWALYGQDDGDRTQYISREEAEVAIRIARRVLEQVDDFDADERYRHWLRRVNR